MKRTPFVTTCPIVAGILSAVMLLLLGSCTADEGAERAAKRVSLQVAPLTSDAATRAPIDGWNNTTVSLGYRTSNTLPYTDNINTLIAGNSGNTTLDTGLEYPVGGTLYLRGYYPSKTLDGDGLLTYNLAGGDVDLMVSQEVSGSTATPFDETGAVLTFEHLLTRVTFDLMCAQDKMFTTKVTGIRIVPDDPTTPMQNAIIDLSKTIDDTTNPLFMGAGNVEHKYTSGYTVPAYSSTRGKRRIDLMFRPGVPFTMYVMLADKTSIEIESTDQPVINLCDMGGTKGARYLINLNFTEQGIAAEMGDWTQHVFTEAIGLPQPANCYMMHPSTATETVLNIPLSRINEYWGGTTNGYGSYGGAANSNANVLTAGEEWTAEVLWADLTSITTANNLKYRNSGTYYEGDFFTVNIPRNCPVGNFVVKVFNKNDSNKTPLWSWHIWVTDYNPDAWTGTPELAHSYSVTGGFVESYSDGSSTTKVWRSGGELYQKVIMDRPLGAIARMTSTAPSLSSTRRGQFYYQYGRKDPFPASRYGSYDLYAETPDIFTNNNSRITIAASVQNPTAFHYRSGGGSWTSIYISGNKWNDSKTGNAKSIYDPCPPGWRVPPRYTWLMFNSDNFSWKSSNPAGRSYSDDNLTVFYAAAGFRRYLSGNVEYANLSGSYWNNHCLSDISASSLSFQTQNSENILYTNNNADMSNGLMVRCVQQ